ncbi:transglycosylase family protein [Luteococcus sp.]|uniref:transglycosylase family protein n=1 Tax=Luteococcus sp. TaxID=1969402 RepID=UPI0037360726
MNKKTIGLIAGATALAAAAGTAGWQVAEKEVQVAVDGQTSTVKTFGGTVADALQTKGIAVGERDTVVPSASSRISDGTRITVNHGRPITLTVDGKKTTLWTTATNLDSALTQLGVLEKGSRLSVSRSTPLGREGLAVEAITPKTVTLVDGGKKTLATSTAATVGELLKERKLSVDSDDKLTPAAHTVLAEKQTIALTRVGSKQQNTTVPIEHETETTRSSSLDKGERKVEVEGKDGVKTQTWKLTVVDGKVTKKQLLTEKVTTKPVTEKVLVGTREQAPESPSSTSASSTSKSTNSKSSTRSASKPSASKTTTAPRPKSSSAGTNTANTAMWDLIAQCESGGNWSINTGNGYYGGLQFDRQTWLANGGGAYAPTANLASKAQQITIANKVYAERGLQPWGCGHAA